MAIFRKLKKIFSLRNNSNSKLLISMFCIFVCYNILTFDFSWYILKEFHINGSSVTPQDLEPFQPAVTDDFPTVTGDTPRIPHIIHQMFNSTLIPNVFVENINSFAVKNPKWAYYFWTDESGRKLIKDRHPKLLKIWDNYLTAISRAEALKYIVLYEFGGVYVDIDFDCIRPLDRATMKYACVFPPEPFEQSIFLNGIPYLISNAIMMCRPKHPFLKLIIANLAQSTAFLEQRDITGPSFLTFNFMAYNNITDMYRLKTKHESNSPYFYSGELPEDHENAVYVPNSIYFIDTLKKLNWNKNHYYHRCRSFEQQSSIVRRACFLLFKKGFDRQKTKYSFTLHHWYESYNRRFSHGLLYILVFGSQFTDISEIVPQFKMYPLEIK